MSDSRSPVRHPLRSRLVALCGLSTAALAGAALFAPTPASAATGCQVTYTVASQWSGGFTANVGVTNLGDALTSWTLTWSFTGGQAVTSAWNATVQQSGSAVTATNASWNGALATNASTSFGFQGTSSGTTNPAPGSFSLNGTTCTGSTTTTTKTTSTTTKTTSSTSTTKTTSTTTGTTTTSSTTTTKTSTTTTSSTPVTGAVYASPTGSASAAGTLSAPTTLATAITKIGAGGTVYLLGGTYNLSSTVTIDASNSGTSSARKTLAAYSGATPVLDFSAQSESSSNRGLQLNGSYWHVVGLVVQHAGDNGIFVGGSNNILERVVTAFNRDSGLQISRIASDTPQSQWPANNLVISSESHDNMDSAGENADGFAAKLTVGTGNVFQYDVSHNNIDDGWDLYTKTDTGAIGPVLIEDSLSYGNGTLTNGTVNANGDRNGFKLGGDKIAVAHTVLRSIAYKNGHDGFTYNSNPGAITVTSNLSIDNTERNFHFEASGPVFSGNTSCRFASGGTNDKVVDSSSSNQWWLGSNGSRCSAYSGALSWSFASNGHLSVTIGGTAVSL